MELSGECLTSTGCVIITGDHSYCDMGEVIGHPKLVFDAQGVARGAGTIISSGWGSDMQARRLCRTVN